MRAMKGLVIVASMLAGGGASAQGPCLRDGQPGQRLEGALSAQRFTDAADRPETAYILTLARPVCLVGADPADKVEGATTVHVFSIDETVATLLKGHVGQHVIVNGEPFAAHTAHHHAPIVMRVEAVAVR